MRQSRAREGAGLRLDGQVRSPVACPSTMAMQSLVARTWCLSSVRRLNFAHAPSSPLPMNAVACSASPVAQASAAVLPRPAVVGRPVTSGE